MKSLLKLVASLSFIAFMSGCSTQMVKSKTGLIQPPTDDQATIVFMRSSFIASGVGVELFEITDGELEFIGNLPNGSKVAHKTEPGQKVYMAYGNAADFMIANVEAGKTYYSIVRPNWWSGGFAPTPIRTDGSSNYHTGLSEFESWKDDSTLLELKPTAQEWFAERRKKYEKIYRIYWNKFQTKSDDKKQQRTLNPQDGI